MTPALIVSIHDIAPATLERSQHWSRELAARQVPATLLVVGGPWGDEVPAPTGEALAAWLRRREAAGDEVALHGWTHRADAPGPWWRRVWGSLVARGAAEFWTLDQPEAALRAAACRDALHDYGLHPVGFTPPGWLASRGAIEALRHLGLRYTTSHLAVTDLTSGRRHPMPVFCHRPGSVLQGAGAGVVRTMVPALIRRGRPVRLGLHPDDLDHRGLRRAALDAIDRALGAGAEPTTYRDYLAGHAREAAA